MDLTPEKLRKIPEAPGVYLFKDGRGVVLYVGKAKNLRRRLSSYLTPNTPKTQNLLLRAKTLETILTRNEKEALILEANLIKKHRPRYNIVLRDDKAYPLIRISLKDKFPRLMVVRRKRKGDQALYFGPYPSSRAVRETVKILTRFFPLRRCSNAEMNRRTRPCLYYQIGKCLAPCVGFISPAKYRQIVEEAVAFLEGRSRDLLQKLRTDMEAAAENLEFERAAVLRDRLRALEKILETQAAVLPEERDLDVFALAQKNEKISGAVLFVRHGKLIGHKVFHLRGSTEEDPWENLLKQFYDEGKLIPETVVLPEIPAERKLLEEWLSELRGGPVEIVRPQDKILTGLYETAQRNAEEALRARLKGEKTWDELAEELATVLRLPVIPVRIEGVDLSSLQGTAPVGAIVSFFEGEPDKSRYRRYHIRTVSGTPDDYAMLYEVLFRRIQKGLAEKDLPDLLLIDGGKGHLETGRRVLEELGLSEKIGLCAIAKEREEEGEKVYIPGRKNPLKLSKHGEVLRFLMRVRDEVHRFVLSFHRKTREKRALSSFLDGIPGIGEKRKRVLLSQFASPEEILAAGASEIASLPGFNRKVAEELITRLKELSG
ncbi:excinuclease ABC subunit UvrC [Thermosulfurimonas dismutans]|uniref:UvrABC system protein C n=1 Tax=Thermosulfurimonas dismutans TaxID=999894 RepID=A0A179D807_9BACT|nr:excinuclease ABC subunit UvrC [Thermosulfurimonas dismutans]OAQ21901.1 Excinuclease ABC subunit C [Thermosulfurimonas dismutans]